jgi:hypothetical protein
MQSQDSIDNQINKHIEAEAAIEQEVEEAIQSEEASSETSGIAKDEEGKPAKNKASKNQSKASSPLSQQAQLISNAVGEISGSQEKVDYLLEKMQEAIGTSTSTTPSFKFFWELRQILLPLFKDKDLNEAQRGQMWARCSQLTAEARKVKQQLESQFFGVAEQVEGAITQLEVQIEAIEATAKEASSDTLFPEVDFSGSLHKNKEHYVTSQSQLALYNLLATRINALRKDLTKMPMRLRDKSRFFQRLSVAGGKIFPARKQHIQHVSDLFSADVNAFIGHHQVGEEVKGLCYDIKREIKNLQGFAKHLSLNPTAFAQTRTQLSKLWDVVRDLEKEIKKQRQEQDMQFQELEGQLKEKIEQFLENRRELSDVKDYNQLSQEIKEFTDSIYKEKLPRRLAKELLTPVMQVQEKLNQIMDAQRAAALEQKNQERQKQLEALNQFKNQIRELSVRAAELSLEELEAQIAQGERDLQSKQKSQELSKQESYDIQRSLRKAHDLLQQRMNAERLSLSKDDAQKLEYLQGMVQTAMERRRESKNQLEEYKKQNGSSGLDFAKAMMYTSLIEEERVALAEIDQQISQFNKEIAQLKGIV